MKTLSIDLEHCYGIKRLTTKFDFSKSSVYAIYAPNGMMKSSFAQTFKDLSNGDESRDRVFRQRTTRRAITGDDGNELTPESVLVLAPYDAQFGSADKTATLLVNPALRQEYEQLFKEIDKSKAAFLKAVKKQSRSKRKPGQLETEISETFTASGQEFYRALIRVKDEVQELPDPQFADVPYDLVADEKVVAFLKSADVNDVLQAYIDTYNDLLEKSKYFRKGTFDYYNASTIATALTKNGFFKANHSVTLNAESKVEVTNEKELAAVIAEEKAAILTDSKLKKSFDEMEKRITKNDVLRGLQEFVAENKDVLALMGNMGKLKEDIWKSYFKAHQDLYLDVIAKFQAAEVRAKEIQAVAAGQRTLWEDVIDIFNRRFFVPFKLEIKNRVDVVIGQAPVPSLSFTFCEGDDTVEMDRPDLLQVLSTGEKKALYILSVIFEVEARRKAQQSTLFVIDDIADSFDYKNKYAIIQYLKDIARDDCFRQIILTHNFDFFRTVNSRFVPYSHCLMVERTSQGLQLTRAAGIKNVFLKDWKLHFFTGGRKRIAAISFIRNLVEYTRGEDDPDFSRLTSLLHWKKDSDSITHGDLDGIYMRLFGASNSPWSAPHTTVLETIFAEAKACLSAPEGSHLENKVVLAIAIRLEAEKHMVKEIADKEFVESITSNQTSVLLGRYRDRPVVDPEAVRTLDEVTLMTPENIHLNSFMYEPIVDMADDHLRQLYSKVLSLNESH